MLLSFANHGLWHAVLLDSKSRLNWTLNMFTLQDSRLKKSVIMWSIQSLRCHSQCVQKCIMAGWQFWLSVESPCDNMIISCYGCTTLCRPNYLFEAVSWGVLVDMSSEQQTRVHCVSCQLIIFCHFYIHLPYMILSHWFQPHCPPLINNGKDMQGSTLHL